MSHTLARPLASVPDLAELAANPALLEDLPTELLVDMRRQLRHLDADLDAALARRLARHDGASEAAVHELDRLLTAEEAGRLAGVTPSWLIRRAKSLPFARKLSHKVVRFSQAGLQRWLATRRP